MKKDYIIKIREMALSTYKMASLPVPQQFFVMLLILLQSSSLLLAQQGVIELHSTQQIKLPTPIKVTPAPLLMSATPIAKIARKFTPTPILLGLASNIQTPLPLRMDRKMVSSTFSKTIAHLSPVPLLAQEFLPTAVPVVSQEIIPKPSPSILQKSLPTAVPVVSQEILPIPNSVFSQKSIPTVVSLLSKEILSKPASVLSQKNLPTVVPVVSQEILPTPNSVLSQKRIPTAVSLLSNEILPKPASVFSQEILPTAVPVLSKKILPRPASVLSQNILPTAASVLSKKILPMPASVLSQNILPTAASVLLQETLPTAAPLASSITNNGVPFNGITNSPITSMKGFVTFSFNNVATHLKEVSSAIIRPTPQSLTSKITNILFPQSDHIVSTISPILGNSHFDINTLFPLKGNFDTLELIKKILNIEPTRIKTVENILDTISMTKSQISIPLISSTRTNQITTTPSTQTIFPNSGTSFSNNQFLTPKLSKKMLSPEPNKLAEKPFISTGKQPETDIFSIFNSGSLNSSHTLPKALSNNQILARQLFQNISSFPAPVYVTIILSPTIILAPTNTSNTMQQTGLSNNTLHVSPSHVQSLKTFFTGTNQNNNPITLQNSDTTVGLMPSKNFIPSDVMTQKVLPTPTLPNTQGQVFETALVPMALIMNDPRASIGDINKALNLSAMNFPSAGNNDQISSKTSNAKSSGGQFVSNFKPFLVNTNNLTARIRPFKPGSDNQNNLSLLETVNQQPHLLRTANPNSFNLPLVFPIGNNITNRNLQFLNRINQHNNLVNQTLSPEFFSALPNKRIINLNQFSNNAPNLPAIIVSNPLIRNHGSPIIFNPAFSQVSNKQGNHQLQQSLNQHHRFSPFLQNTNTAGFNLPIVLPFGNNLIPGHSSIIKKIQAQSNFQNNNLALRNHSALTNNTIPSLNSFHNNSSKVPVIIVSKPNSSLQPFLIRNRNSTTLITPNQSFNQVPEQANPQLHQAVNKQPFASPLVQNPNNSSRVPVIILSKPNTNLQPFFISNGNLTTLIRPNQSFNQVPDSQANPQLQPNPRLQPNPQLHQAVNKQPFASPLVPNPNFSNFNLPFVFPPRNTKFTNQVPNLQFKNDNVGNQNLSLGNTSLGNNQTHTLKLDVFRLKNGFTPLVSNSSSFKQTNTTLHNNLIPNQTNTLKTNSPILTVQTPPLNNLQPNASATSKVFTRLKNLQQTIKHLQNNSQINNTLHP